FSLPLDGGPAVVLESPVGLFGGIESFSISSDSRVAVFVVPERRNLKVVPVLYGAPIDGSSASVALVERVRQYVLAVNGKSVFAAADTVATPTEPARTELHVVPSLGGS